MNVLSPTTHRAIAAATLAVGSAAILRRFIYTRTSSSLRQLVAQGKKAVCVGKNYRAHINELASLGPEWKLEEEPEPVLFLKPTTSYAWPGEPLVLPRARPERGLVAQVKHGVHHELELAVIIGKAAKDVADAEEAMKCVAGYALALDCTQRDEQTAAKVKGMPWSVSKGHDSFLPLSEPFVLGAGEDWRRLRLWLEVNGARRQECEAGAMIHGVPELVMYTSRVMSLEPGDLLVTGTPEGVGRLCAGDVITAGVEGHVEVEVAVSAPTPPPLNRLTTPHRLPLADPLITRCDPPIRQPAPEPLQPGALARGRLLDGLAVAVKDNIDVAGCVSGNGSPSWQSGRAAAASHAPPVSALLGAGARIVGKAHMDELAFSVSGENAAYGTLDNPIAPGRTVGGSSSGSAVAVAMGLCDVALGSDTTGSVRVPAAHCGLYGMRPSHGALSGEGICALAPSFDTVGWVARSGQDLAAVGEALLPRSAPRDVGASARVLIVDDAIELYRPADPDALAGPAARRALSAAAEAAATALSTPSAKSEHIRLGEMLLAAAPALARFADPAHPADGLGALLGLMREAQAIEIWSALGSFVEPRGDRPKPALGFDVAPRAAWAKGVAHSAAGTPEAEAARSEARAQVGAFLNDLLADGSVLCFIPVAAPPPPPTAAADDEYRRRSDVHAAGAKRRGRPSSGCGPCRSLRCDAAASLRELCGCGRARPAASGARAECRRKPRGTRVVIAPPAQG